MCGIIAFIDLSKNITLQELDIATDAMALRGPDARGSLILENENYNIGFGHRRLSILDLDKRSNQPFKTDRLTIVFNGEIYNFKDIKSELKDLDYQFKTTSDTEVILQAYTEWGESFVEKFKGMFSFFIYDQEKEEVIIVRDRLGVKPLYIYKDDTKIIVSSQVNTIQLLLSESLSIDEAAVHGFFSLGYVPGEHSVFSQVKKFKPGTLNRINLVHGINITEKNYWNINDIKKLELSENQKVETLKNLLTDAIKLRLISDVKVGSFLSGGLDSSYVTKILNDNSKDLNSFTIGFKEKFDEAPHAKKVAEYIGTQHHTKYLEAKDVNEILKNFANYFDEPFSDDAAIPMLFLSMMSKEEVKVVISSDGGDEVFAGYSRYLKSLKVNKFLSKIPFMIRFFIKAFASLLFQLLPKRNKISNALWRIKKIVDKDKQQQLAKILLYGDMIPDPELKKILDSSITSKDFQHNYFNGKKKLSPTKQLLFIDIGERLVNQMLVKVDKTTMGASVEGREPLLDYRLFEFMVSCDDSDLIKEKQTKHIFRKLIFEEFGNKELLNKPKMGFNTPIYDWLRFSFSEYVENEFKSINKYKIPYLKEVELLSLWDEFKNGKTYYQSLIWRSLIWIQWYKKYKLNNNEL